MVEPVVHILMSTYNGSEFLEDQLNSILKQTYTNWQLIIRDDGSNDFTLEILSQYSGRDSRISIITDSFGNLKSCGSFSKLMQFVENSAQYIMFCDQDDIWVPAKIELSLNEILRLECKLGRDVSLLVYGTYQLISRDSTLLNIPPPRYPKELYLELLIAQNYVYGCTTIINSHLLRKATQIPLEAENHDYWIALTAIVTGGVIKYLDQPLLFYRQHQNNVSGSYRDAFIYNRVIRLITSRQNKILNSRLKMLAILYFRFENSLSISHYTLLKDYIRFVNKGGIKAVIFCIKMNIRKLSLPQTFVYYIGVFGGLRNK